ncbi:MAG: FAD-binding domain-containing protein [Methylocystis sp.]
MIAEQEILDQVLSQHSFETAQKYIDEILWRSYWKGWLELHPSLWSFYNSKVKREKSIVDPYALRQAEQGITGIEGFDDWARELNHTGYLHNHARMWFASIWIFTLELPWVLGADYFLRHLIDADVASNTLSWRWIAGLHTRGKSYLATSENINRYTGGRFNPKGLAKTAFKINDGWQEDYTEIMPLAQPNQHEPSILLIHHDDLYPEIDIIEKYKFQSVIIIYDKDLLFGDKAQTFVKNAIDDCKERFQSFFKGSILIKDKLDCEILLEISRITNTRQIITSYAPVGPIEKKFADIEPKLAQNGVSLVQLRRRWDDYLWPKARHSFFKFRESVLPGLKSNKFVASNNAK